MYMIEGETGLKVGSAKDGNEIRRLKYTKERAALFT